jgi:hypothetical protein
VVRKLKEVLEEGRIGKIVNAEVRAAGGLNNREVVPQGLEYFTRREVGGNVFNIGLGHRESMSSGPVHRKDWLLTFVSHGRVGPDPIRPRRRNGHPVPPAPPVPARQLRDSASNTILKTATSDVPDCLLVLL